jgi:PPP family 3-phenylpropionic acid transporter
MFARLPASGWLQWAALAAALRFAATAAWADVVVVLVLAQALHALSFAAHHAACVVQISRHFPGALRSRGQALYTVLGYGLSGVLGGLGGGWLSARWGFAAVFWASALTALVGLACARRAARLQR